MRIIDGESYEEFQKRERGENPEEYEKIDEALDKIKQQTISN